MATITVSVPKKVIQTVNTDVALEDLPGCTWQLADGTQLRLLDSATQDIVGTITDGRVLQVNGKLIPAGTTFGNVIAGLS